MYCSRCGAIIEEGTKFCVKCGAKVENPEVGVSEDYGVLEENNETLQMPPQNRNRKEDKRENRKVKQPIEKKALSKKTKGLIAVLSIVFVMVGTGIGISIYITSATFCIKGYAKAIVNGKWEKSVEYVVGGAADDGFINWANTVLTPIDSYTIQEINESDSQKEYKVTFVDEEDKEVYQNRYIVQRQEKNRMLLFPNWKMDNSSLVVKEAILHVPKGAQLFVDGSEVDITTMEDDADGNKAVVLQNLYAGPHLVKMTKQFYQIYEKSISITEQIASKGIEPLELTVSENVIQDVSFQVVSGSELIIDDVKVEKEYRTSVADGVDTYVIPFLEKGEHKVKASKKYYEDYEETIQFAQSVETSFVEEQNVKESEAWRVVYQEFLTAVSHWDMDVIEAEYSETVSDMQALYDNYNYQRDTHGYTDLEFEFAIIRLNDDEVPEIYVKCGFVGMLFTYIDGSVQAIQDDTARGDSYALMGGERIVYGIVLDEGLIFEGGASGAGSSTGMSVNQFDGAVSTTKVVEISADYENPEYSYINERDVTPEEADAKMDEYLNRESNITTQLLNEGNIQNAIWGVEIDWESSIDPSMWLNAFINQMYDEDIVYIDDTAFEVAFYDINQDGLPEIKIDGVGFSKLLYLDNNMKLCEMACDLCWILTDGTVVMSYYIYDASQPIEYHEYQYDKETGIYKEQSEAKSIETEEFLAMEDNPNMDNYKIMGVFAFEEATARLEELAKHAASTMGVTSDITEAREKNELKSGAEFEGIGLSEKVKAEDFKAYLDAYCENYTYMVTEKKFGYMQDYLYYGDKPSKGYDCVTEMQRMLGYDVIDSMTLTSTKIKDVTKMDEDTVQMRTVENYHVYYNMSLEQIKKNTKIYEQCKDKVSEDISEYQVEVNIKQKVFYELKLDGNQWKFYRYMEGVDQTTEVVDCKAR